MHLVSGTTEQAKHVDVGLVHRATDIQYTYIVGKYKIYL